MRYRTAAAMSVALVVRIGGMFGLPAEYGPFFRFSAVAKTGPSPSTTGLRTNSSWYCCVLRYVEAGPRASRASDNRGAIHRCSIHQCAIAGETLGRIIPGKSCAAGMATRLCQEHKDRAPRLIRNSMVDREQIVRKAGLPADLSNNRRECGRQMSVLPASLLGSR